MQVSEGRLTLAPVLSLAAQPATVDIAGGPLLTKVHLTQEMCARTQIRGPDPRQRHAGGRLVLGQIGAGKLPLADPWSGNLPGRMQIHSIDVRPGAFAGELVGLARQVETILNPTQMDARAPSLLTISNQDVDFRLVDRRVYHRNLQFKAGPMTVTTHGSVGIDDESLAIIATFNVPDTWMGKFAGARQPGQGIEVPIEGTLSKPKFDAKIIPAVAGSLIGGAVEGAAEKILQPLGKRLDQLFPPKN